MNARENLRWQVFAAECGIAFEILFTIFWGFFGHNLPPAAPSLTGPQLAAHFAAHRNAILFGNSMAALVAVLWIPWTAQLTVVMRRIEGAIPVNNNSAKRRNSDCVGAHVLPRDLGDGRVQDRSGT